MKDEIQRHRLEICSAYNQDHVNELVEKDRDNARNQLYAAEAFHSP